MYTNHLKDKLKEKGFTYTEGVHSSSPSYLAIEDDGVTVARVNLVSPLKLTTAYPQYRMLSYERRLDLYQLLTEYVETPVKNRTPETVYAYFLIDVAVPLRYVNYTPLEKAVSINTIEHEYDYHTHFTDSYIEQHPTLDAWLAKYADVLDTEIIEKGGERL